MDVLVRHQSDLYWTALLGALIVTLLWELRIPVRSAARDQRQRWSLNFTLLLVNQVVTFAAVPIASVSLAVKAAEAGWGLFNHFQLGSITAVVASMLAIDLAKYLQHYALHRVPLLWRIHRTHHADPDCDVTTSFRFHPLEIFATLLVEAAVIVAFGVPAGADGNSAAARGRHSRPSPDPPLHGLARADRESQRWIDLVGSSLRHIYRQPGAGSAHDAVGPGRVRAEHSKLAAGDAARSHIRPEMTRKLRHFVICCIRPLHQPMS
jgi:hypothetical protein